MGAALVPLLTTAVGVGVSQYNTKKTEGRQRDELNRLLQVQGERDQQGQALVGDAVNRVASSSPDEARQSSMDKYLKSIAGAQGMATQGLGQAGAVSDRYAEGAEGAAADIYNTSAGTADMLSRIDAPINQRQEEGILFGRLGSDIGRVGAQSRADDWLYRLRLQKASQRDPFLDALGQGLSSYGSGGGSFGMGG